MHRLLLSVSAIALITPLGVRAAETITYTYDAQGRLVQSVIGGTINNGQTSSTTFDAANNRTNYSVSVAGAPPSPPPPPPPTPAPNNPPVSVADAMLSVVCDGNDARNVLGNDTDPDGDLPLSFTLTGGSGIDFVAKEGAQSIRFFAPRNRGATYSVSYVITDARGATTNASLALRVTGTVAQCGGGGGVQQIGAPPPPDPAGGSGGG